jgi:hypothetical protein
MTILRNKVTYTSYLEVSGDYRITFLRAPLLPGSQ